MAKRINLVHELNVGIGLSIADIGHGLESRALSQQGQAFQADARELLLWIRPEIEPPEWVRHAAALWIIEYWLNERDSCGADQLLQVDAKYTRLLRDFSMGEIIAMRNQLMRAAG